MARLNSKNSVGNISIENAQIGFRNFSGKEGKFNAAGNRNFVVFLEKDLATQLERDGWNVRWLKARDPEEDVQGILQVKVGFGNYPPKIVLVKPVYRLSDMQNASKSELHEDTVHILDWAELDHVDLIIRPYSYDVNGKQGIKAYLKTMYAVLSVDPFADRYEFTPDSAQDSVGGCGDCATCSGKCGKKEHL